MNRSIKLQSRVPEPSSKPSLDLKIIYRRIDELKPDPANPRRHSKKQIRQIAHSTKCSALRAYARGSGSSTCCARAAPASLGGLADQHDVGSWDGAGADAQEGIERGMPCPASIEAEHKLIQVVLKVRPPQSMVDAEAPALEI